MKSICLAILTCAVAWVSAQTDNRTPEQKAFIKAVVAGDKTTVAQMLASAPSLVNTRTKLGATAVMASVYVNKPEITKMLLRHHPEIDIWTACTAGLARDVRRLLKTQKGLINQRSQDGGTPLCLSVAFGHPDVAKILINAGASLTARSLVEDAAPINSAAFGRNLACVRVLVEAGAPVDQAEPDGNTPLMEAASNGDLGIVRYLVAHYAKVARKDKNGQTAYDVAVKNKRRVVAEFLKSKGG